MLANRGDRRTKWKATTIESTLRDLGGKGGEKKPTKHPNKDQKKKRDTSTLIHKRKSQSWRKNLEIGKERG